MLIVVVTAGISAAIYDFTTTLLKARVLLRVGKTSGLARVL